MTQINVSFNTGPEGADITTTTEPSLSSVFLTSAASTSKYRASKAIRGAFGAELIGVDTESAYYVVTLNPSSANVVALVGFTIDNTKLPPTGSVLYLARFRNATAQAMVVALSATGKVSIQNRSGVFVTGTNMNNNTALPDGQYFLQVQLQVNTTTGTASTVTAQIFDETGVAQGASVTSSAVDTGTGVITLMHFGKTTTAGLVYGYFDEIKVNSGTTTPIAVPAVDAPTPPTAEAGVAQSVEPWATVNVDGSASSAVSPATIASYTWTQVSGPTVTLTGTGATRSFTAPAVTGGGTVVLGLTVTDSAGRTSPQDTVAITVGGPTEFYAGTDGIWHPLRTVRL